MALAALGLHLLHGIQSSFQTWGLNNERTLPVFEKSGTLAAVILFLWYSAISGCDHRGIIETVSKVLGGEVAEDAKENLDLFFFYKLRSIRASAVQGSFALGYPIQVIT